MRDRTKRQQIYKIAIGIVATIGGIYFIEHGQAIGNYKMVALGYIQVVSNSIMLWAHWPFR
jgi:hypothetical protein